MYWTLSAPSPVGQSSRRSRGVFLGASRASPPVTLRVPRPRASGTAGAMPTAWRLVGSAPNPHAPLVPARVQVRMREASSFTTFSFPSVTKGKKHSPPAFILNVYYLPLGGDGDTVGGGGGPALLRLQGSLPSLQTAGPSASALGRTQPTPVLQRAESTSWTSAVLSEMSEFIARFPQRRNAPVTLELWIRRMSEPRSMGE